MNHRFYPSFEARFWDCVDVRGPDECWEWKSTRAVQGYGVIQSEDRQLKAHRVALELSGVNVGDRLVCHRCDNRPCCNPKHLYAGTHDDNMRDRNERGRVPKGQECWAARLNEDIVQFIRVFYGAGIYTKTQLAERFGVSVPAIRKVVDRVSWKHVA